MATVAYTATSIVGGYAVMWQNLASGDTCFPFPFYNEDASGLTDRSVQVVGGTVGSVHIQGSNAIDVVQATKIGYATLNDPSSTALTLTTASIKQVLEHTMFIRPALTNAASGTNVLMKVTNPSWRI